MTTDKRNVNPGNSSSQKGVFHGILKRFSGHSRDDHVEGELIDNIVKIVEPRIKDVRGYRKRLQQPLRNCRAHCKAMITKIPGPIYLEESRYYDNPTIKAIFCGSERIEDLLEKSKRTAAQQSLLGKKRVALLTMTSKEKTFFGRKQQGEMVLGDSLLRAIDFTNHNVVGLTTTLEASLEALERYSLEIIFEAAARELSEVRNRLVDLRERHERLRAMNKMFGENRSVGMGSVLVPYDPEWHEKKKKLEQMLSESESEIADVGNGCETPNDMLNFVEKYLSKPEEALTIHPVSLRLDWRNVFTEDPNEKANTISLATFTLAHEMQREGVLIAYEQY